MEGSHLVVICILKDSNFQLPTHALVDCGATGYAFIDEDFARHYNLPLYCLKTPRSLEFIDGRPIESGDVTHLTKLTMTVDKHTETLLLFVTKLGHHPIVLGIPWLRHHDVHISFSKNTLSFDSNYCLTNCATTAATTKGISIPIPEKQGHQICMINTVSFRRLTRKLAEYKIFSASLQEINAALKDTQPTNEELIKKHVSPEYHEFARLLSGAHASKLPPHRPYDHKIPIKEEFTPPFGPLYSLSKNEL